MAEADKVIELCQSFDELCRQRLLTRRPPASDETLASMTAAPEMDSMLGQIKEFVRAEVARQLSLLSSATPPPSPFAANLSQVIQEQVFAALPSARETTPLPAPVAFPEVTAPLSYAEALARPPPPAFVPSPSVASIHLQESSIYLLRPVADNQEDNEEWQSESSPDSITLMVCMFGLLLGIMITALLTIYFLSNDSVSEVTMKGTKAPESAGGSIAVPSVESITPQQSLTMETATVKQSVSVTPAPVSTTKAVRMLPVPPVVGTITAVPTTVSADTALPTTVSAETALPTTVSPSVGASDNVCTTDECHFLAQWLRQKLDAEADPCEDFYRFVCGTFKGPGTDAFAKVNHTMTSIIIGAAYAARVPTTGQTSWQKAAGMFQACISLFAEHRSETADLVAWMTSIDLDLNNGTALQSVDPKDMMVRCSLDFGVQAIIFIKLFEVFFFNNKRGLVLTYSERDSEWQASVRNIPEQAKLGNYVRILSLYGLVQNETARLASLISQHESKLDNIVLHENVPQAQTLVGSIRSMGMKTRPYVKGEEWSTAISKYTNNTYNGDDLIVYKTDTLNIVAALFKSVKRQGISYLIAWSVYRQLLPFTSRRFVAKPDEPSQACYYFVRKVMKLAIAAPYLLSVTNQKTLNETASMVDNIRRAYRTAFETSSWVTGDVRKVAIQKLANMKYYVGSPGQRLDPAVIEKYYDSVPDVTTDKFFDAWRKALSASSHQTWADQKTWIFDEAEVDAYYATNLNIVVITTAILQLPFFYTGAPPAINYGGIGMVVGHEIMHGYDVSGTMYDASGTQRQWATPEFLANYTEKALCLRQSHKAAKKMKARQDVLDDTLDSENLADFAGAAIAHAAYASLPALQRNLKLPSLNLTAEQLFFIGHCAKWCESMQVTSARYAPGRSRCIVPLLNMVEFSDAFGCAPGTPMNPAKKCVFWL
nr:neprilysin-1-like [Dermacentor andersoni]